MYKLDHALLKLTMRIAHWLDYRWHINNYRVARWFSIIAAMCAVMCPILYFMPPVEKGAVIWAVVFLLPVNTFCAWSYLRRADDFQTMGNKFERDPSVAPYEAILYLLMPPFIRLGSLTFTVIIMLPLIPLELLDPKHGIIVAVLGIISRFWLFFGDCVALYFAGIPPSHRKRKEKKAFEWMPDFMPQPMGN